MFKISFSLYHLEMINPSPQVKLTLILLAVWEKSVVLFRNGYSKYYHSFWKAERIFLLNSSRNKTFWFICTSNKEEKAISSWACFVGEFPSPTLNFPLNTESYIQEKATGCLFNAKLCTFVSDEGFLKVSLIFIKFYDFHQPLKVFKFVCVQNRQKGKDVILFLRIWGFK